jgi:hypothetical protein
MVKQVRGLKQSSGETAKAMQVGSHMTGAQDSSVVAEFYTTQAEAGIDSLVTSSMEVH